MPSGRRGTGRAGGPVGRRDPQRQRHVATPLGQCRHIDPFRRHPLGTEQPGQ